MSKYFRDIENIFNAMKKDIVFNDKNIEKLYKVFSRIEKKGEHISYCRKLKSGGFGTAFKINKKTVLKITTDKSEGHTMSIIQKYPNKNIVKVKDVFKCMLFWSWDKRKSFYFIVEEFLNKPKIQWQDFIDYCFEEDKDGESQYATRSLFEKSKREDVIFSHIKPEILKQQWEWLDEVVSYLEEHNIKFGDFHSGNIMRKRKHHILIDLGLSISPKQKIDVI